MKTKLPDKIETVQQAKEYITNLWDNREEYHPEDSAHDIVWSIGIKPPTKEEADKMDQLMEDVYNLKGNDGRHCGEMVFDPCKYLMDLERWFIYKDKTGRGLTNKLNAAHILDNWDMQEEDWNSKPLKEYIEEAELGDEWETESLKLIMS